MSKEFFSEENIPPSNWMKFAKVEDRIKGTLLSVAYKEAEEGFKPQWVYELEVKKDDVVVIEGEEQEKGVWFVGISVEKAYVNNGAKRANKGQKLGFKFIKEIPPTQKGFNPAKSITPYIGEIDKSYDGMQNMTPPEPTYTPEDAPPITDDMIENVPII